MLGIVDTEYYTDYEVQPERNASGEYRAECPVCHVVLRGVYMESALERSIVEHLNAWHAEVGH